MLNAFLSKPTKAYKHFHRFVRCDGSVFKILKNPRMDFSSESNFPKRRKWTIFFYRFLYCLFRNIHTHSYRFAGWLNRSNLYALPSNLFTVVDSFFVVSRGSESKWLWVCLLLQFENTLRDASLSIYKEHTQQSNSRINKWKKRQRQ